MKFSELLNLPFGWGSKIDMSVLADALPNFPEDVLEQFCSDHGRNEEFQSQYGGLELLQLRWANEKLPAQEWIDASVFEHFQLWAHESVPNRAMWLKEQGWPIIDVRERVVEHWRRHRTWMRPPVFLDGRLVERTSELHLVEGHTRLGLLIGFVKEGIIEPTSTHEAWVGRAIT